jgi:pimeloyl-ACP methyl ester carboxylesterase
MYIPTAVKFLSLLSGEKIFYREAGPIDAPTVLLLHGFPSSSHQFRNLIPMLSPEYRVIAPDFPGYGFTEVPDSYNYTFENLATTIGDFVENVPHAPEKFAIYIFDYGAPVGLRMALKNPSSIAGIFTQNGNAYVEGLGPAWADIKKLWKANTTENRDNIRPFLTLKGTKSQYVNGEPHPEAIAPESYHLDQERMNRPGNKDIQLDLFYDYRTNVDLYPEIQQYFRDSQVPLRAVWGKNDQFFIPPGARAFKRDLPNAEISFLDAGHFAGESHTVEIGRAFLEFLEKQCFKN